MSKKCVKCGYILRDYAKFCDECGGSQANSQWNPQMNMYNNQSSFSNQMYVPGYGNEKQEKVLGIISLVTGIISMLTFGIIMFPQIIAIVCGITGIGRQKRRPFSIAGLVMGVIAMIVGIAIYILAALDV